MRGGGTRPGMTDVSVHTVLRTLYHSHSPHRERIVIETNGGLLKHHSGFPCAGFDAIANRTATVMLMGRTGIFRKV